MRILKNEETELKFIVVNRNMIQKETIVILEFDKEINSNYQVQLILFWR